jgi:hypothetical protein
MKLFVRLALGISFTVAALVASSRDACAQDDEGRDSDGDSAAMAANKGLSFGFGPVVLLPSRDGGPYGGGLDLEARYGFKAGPTVIAPGGRLAGYVMSSRFVGIAMPTIRWVLPVGPLAPFVVGGVGPGWISNPSEGGLALLGGGGLMVHFGRIFAIGAEASYQTITGTELSTVVVGPSFRIGG